jgi:hypothetical protein
MTPRASNHNGHPQQQLQLKVKLNFTPPTDEGTQESEGISPLILNLISRYQWAVSFKTGQCNPVKNPLPLNKKRKYIGPTEIRTSHPSGRI